MYSYGNIPLCVNRSKFFALKNFDRVIFNLSLSRYDANFSKLDVKNLNESINRFIKFFLLFLVLSTNFVNEVYFSLVMGNSSVHPLRGSYNKVCVVAR